jgi:hypothetical protein
MALAIPQLLAQRPALAAAAAPKERTRHLLIQIIDRCNREDLVS